MAKTTAQKVIAMFEQSELICNEWLGGDDIPLDVKEVVEFQENSTLGEGSYLTGFPFLIESFKQVYHKGGSDQGSHYETVYEFQPNNQAEKFYLRFIGYYNSYNGFEFETVKEATPYTFTETRYK